MGWFRFRQGKEKPGATPKPLHTRRLELRAFATSDAEDMFAYAKNPAVGLMAGWSPHQTLEETRAVLSRLMEDGEVWAIVEKRIGRVIGSIGLHKDPKRQLTEVRSLGYVLGESAWGQGFATEAAREVLRFAFEEMACPLVSVCHYPHNPRSKRVIEKLGFVREGELRMASVLPDGRVCGSVCYSLTREEYFALRAQEAEKE